MTPRRTDPLEVVRPIVWPELLALLVARHYQGEHISIVGPTGSGKSVLMRELVLALGNRTAEDNRPARVTVCGTKPRDRTLDAYKKRGYKTIKSWPPEFGEEHVIVWPRGGSADTITARQSVVFRKLLNRIWKEGGQTVCFDEMADFDEPPPEGMGLKAVTSKYWRAARALDLTVIGATQRPRNVARGMWSEASFVFIFTPDDEDDLERVAKLSGFKREVFEYAPELGTHEFLLVWRQRTDRGGHKAMRALFASRVV